MRLRLLSIIISATFTAALAHARATAFIDVQREVDQAAAAFQNFDRDQDGTPEIRTLKRLAGEKGRGAGTVLVLVESRLLDRKPGLTDLRPALATFGKDIANGGPNAFVLETSFYDGPEHQDGLTLIAYRDFLRRLWLRIKDFEGVILVGNFPQPFMVRQYAWRRDDPVTLFAGTKSEISFNQPWMRDVAEPVVSPADIVLADLDGRWDRLYIRQPTNIADLYAVFPQGSDTTQNWEMKDERYEDFFMVEDGPWTERDLGGHNMRFTFDPEPNEECTESDKKLPNPLALPEIAVSRINAYHAGVMPDPKIRGVKGEGLLDDNGKPETVEFSDAKSVPNPMNLWVPSAALERTLLVQYFARNHAYRTGKYDSVLGASAVSTDLGSDYDDLRKNVPGWKNLSPSEFLEKDITITDVAKWMEQPELVREIRAHSNPVLSEFGRPRDLAALTAATGGQPWYWTREGDKLVPSLQGIGGAMGFGFLRTLYENRALPDNGVLYFHTGCEATRPLEAENEPFNAPGYGRWQLAECTMMYGNGLALIGRGKVFYDEPREFWKVLGEGGDYGDAWKRYFQVESQDAQLAKDGIGRKRTYFWSLLGDFTLRLPNVLLKGAQPGSGKY
ncbi:MAG TPA: hypothetical protein VMI31_13755 [Fimbriimonadaceae bacterium]|nr:hypothetical protein [Fimbriimonadaceae bacterium]